MAHHEMSWIDDNSIVGQESGIMELKKALMNQFECEDCGPMDEYIGCTIEKLKTGGVKFRQKVLLQSYRDEFDILNMKKFNTPATPGTVLKKPDKKAKKFWCPRNRHNIVLVWGRECT